MKQHIRNSHDAQEAHINVRIKNICVQHGLMKISQASLASFNVQKAGFSPAQSFSLRQKSSPQCLTSER